MTEPAHLLQINVISARDLASVSRSMRTYALVWVNPARKMMTRVDLKGNNSPKWNDKFMFKVTPEFLNSSTATVSVEIYAESWIRDTIVGLVQVPACSITPANPNKSNAKRAVALQVRRPSGRPQGILNIAVSILDGSNKSMPLSGIGFDDKPQTRPEKIDPCTTLRRVKSERSCSALDEEVRPRSTCNGPGSDAPAGGSMCNSDVGPSPSVVAAAVAKGLYIPPTKNRGGGGKDDAESSILQWADEESEDGIMTKIEQWKTELNHAPVSSYNGGNWGDRRRRRHRRTKTEGSRLFRCFGKAYGFEFTIVCGANGKSGKKVGNKRDHPASSNGDTQSYISL